MTVKLKALNKRHAARFTKVARPIIIASEEKVDVCRHQITIEINHAGCGDHPQILGALLTLAAQLLHRAHQQAIETIWQTSKPATPIATIQSDPPVP